MGYSNSSSTQNRPIRQPTEDLNTQPASEDPEVELNPSSDNSTKSKKQKNRKAKTKETRSHKKQHHSQINKDEIDDQGTNNRNSSVS